MDWWADSMANWLTVVMALVFLSIINVVVAQVRNLASQADENPEKASRIVIKAALVVAAGAFTALAVLFLAYLFWLSSLWHPF